MSKRILFQKVGNSLSVTMLLSKLCYYQSISSSLQKESNPRMHCNKVIEKEKKIQDGVQGERNADDNKRIFH